MLATFDLEISPNLDDSTMFASLPRSFTSSRKHAYAIVTRLVVPIDPTLIVVDNYLDNLIEVCAPNDPTSLALYRFVV